MISEFALIVDKNNNAKDIVYLHDDVIYAVIREFDKNNPNDAPHKVYIWSPKNSYFIEYK